VIGRAKSLFTETGDFLDVVDEWRVPSVRPDQFPEIRQSLDALERYLEPAPPDRLVGRVGALLAHYYVADHAPAVQRALAHDWADALAEYPFWAVSVACQKWLRMERRRPTIADIRDLCQRLVRDDMRDRDRLRKILERAEEEV
jgi:hypothetical protein